MLHRPTTKTRRFRGVTLEDLRTHRTDLRLATDEEPQSQEDRERESLQDIASIYGEVA